MNTWQTVVTEYFMGNLIIGMGIIEMNILEATQGNQIYQLLLAKSFMKRLVI